MDELRALSLAKIAMSSEERVEINIAVRDLWMIVNALQLSMTHKALHEPLRGWMEEIGVRCQDVITTVLPEVGELLELGWHRENDVTELPVAPYNPVEDESHDTYFHNMLDDEGRFYDETPDGNEYYDDEGEYVSQRLEQMWALQELIVARLVDPPVDASTEAVMAWMAENRALAEKLKHLQAITDEDFDSLDELVRDADDASNFGQDDPAAAGDDHGDMDVSP